jgi:hypothetical protein
MTRRTRLALAIAFPALVVVAVTVHALWYAYTRTFNEAKLHMIGDHIGIVLSVLWGGIAVIAGVLTWAIATRLDRGSRARGHRPAR